MQTSIKENAQEYFDKVNTEIVKAEENNEAVWTGEDTNDDDFQNHIKGTAKKLLGAIEKTATAPYPLEAKELAQLTKAVCDLQNSFFSKNDNSGMVVMTNQLSMFKGMLK